jgi:hypothetical protein
LDTGQKAAPGGRGMWEGAAPPPKSPLYRRLIDIQAGDSTEVTVWMEDNFHCFAVRLRHDGGMVAAVDVIARRTPWSTCGAAAAKLQALVGQSLVPRSSIVGEMLNMRMQCTHMFDLAGLALAAAANGVLHRVYQATVTLRDPMPARGAPHTGRCSAILCRDGTEILRWIIEDQTIAMPDHRSLLRGFRAWTESLSADDAEAALVLRRAVDVSGGLSVDLDNIGSPLELGLPPVCHSYQPDQAALARRNKGMSRDFRQGFETMLADRRFSA